jgi:nucleoside-triphosphatase
VLLITGSPGSGKTTVIRKVAAALSGRRLGGFYTEEIRVRGERKGFRLATFDGQERVMAHVDFRGPHRVGKYGVDVSVIDALAESALAEEDDAEVYLVDEIGKMECMSPRFVAALRGLLDSGKPVVATIAQKGGGFIVEVKAREDVELWEVTRANRDGMPREVLAWLEKRQV